jgi:phytoene desaturase
MVVVLKKCYRWRKTRQLKGCYIRYGAKLGTGCQMFSIVLCWFCGKTTDYYELIKLSPAYRVYFGVDEFIAIADSCLKSKLLSKRLKKGKRECFCTNSQQTKSNYDIAIKDLVYTVWSFTIRTSNGRNNKKDRSGFFQQHQKSKRDVRKKFQKQTTNSNPWVPCFLFLNQNRRIHRPFIVYELRWFWNELGIQKTGMFDMVKPWKRRRARDNVSYQLQYWKIIVENKTATAIIVNSEKIISDLV